ncbi:MAG: hypothetical protein AB1779_03975 [Candidatus Thermoplasmatota archaeon]
MMPEHCGYVAMKNLPCELKMENIKKFVLGKKIYIKTEFLILKNKRKYAVLKLKKNGEGGFFKKIISFEVISEPSNTSFIFSPKTDVLCKSEMLELSKKYRKKTLIVKGEGGHISFIKRENGIKKLIVVDIVPPYKSRLFSLVKKTLQRSDYPIIVEEKPIDVFSIINKVKTKVVMLPCKVCNLKTKKKILYLENVPNIDDSKLTLIGCNLSRRIFKYIYNFSPEFINICPREVVKEKSFSIARCCELEKTEFNGKKAFLPWGCRLKDVEEAINVLFDEQ